MENLYAKNAVRVRHGTAGKEGYRHRSPQTVVGKNGQRWGGGTRRPARLRHANNQTESQSSLWEHQKSLGYKAGQRSQGSQYVSRGANGRAESQVPVKIG